MKKSIRYSLMKLPYTSPFTVTKKFTRHWGKKVCLLVDIALAKGGPESVVESYYSVMKSQQHDGGQDNKNLSLRAKLDWSLPNLLQCERMIKDVSRLYLHGDKKNGLKKHALPTLGDKNPYKRSKVSDRLEQNKEKLPFLQ